MDPYDDIIPASQLADEAFQANPTLPHGPITFVGAFTTEQQAAAGEALNGNGSPCATPNPPFSIERAGDPYAVRHGKLINDPIHGTYRLDPACTLIFDTRQFQRLRRLKQLGLTYYVFPGASHNRFEHSLGVAHLSNKFVNQIWSFQKHELDIERSDMRLVQLAGLCHDLGHGPFSHVFEREFLMQRGVTGWEHEDMSAKMLDYILDDNAIDALDPADVTRVKALITAGHMAPAGGTAAPSPYGRARWLGEIVANGRNSIDVDKFDYLARDAQYCGVKIACDFSRIMQFAKVIDDEICYKYTEYMNIHELFHARATMHRSVYTHKKAKAIEYMVVDALLEADRALKITEKIWDPADFVRLDDGLLDLVENFDVLGNLLNVDEGDEAAIRSAQAIIARLRRRELYKYVTDAPIPIEMLERGKFVAPTSQDIVSCYSGSGEVTLRAEDVIIQENKIDYSMRDRNPLDHVHFFDYLESQDKRKLRPDQISSMVVAAFEEKRLRVYSRNADPKYVTAVHEAFENWVRRRFGGAVTTSTPAKPVRQAAAAATLAASTGGGGGAKRGRQLFGGGLPPVPPLKHLGAEQEDGGGQRQRRG